jgi:hypothetical protein
MRWPRKQHLSRTRSFPNSWTDGWFPARAAEVEAHLPGCESCRAKLGELRSLKAMLAALPQAQPRQSFAVTEPSARPVRRPASGRPGWLTLVPATALTALLVLLAVDFTVIGGSEDRSGSATSLAQKAAQSDSAAFSAPTAAGGAAARDNAGLAPAPAAQRPRQRSLPWQRGSCRQTSRGRRCGVGPTGTVCTGAGPRRGRGAGRRR